MTINAVNLQSAPPGSPAWQLQLRQKVSEVVNQTFYGTLMRQFCDSQQPGLLDNGPGGTTFIRQLDLELISRISRRGDAPLTEALVKQLRGKINPTHDLPDAKAVAGYQYLPKTYSPGNING